ncbi:uncharacterized protein ACA1_060380 [Acanthamoeba castellanii str. Neff]|uniref:Autophagy-related protein 13 N-terminal domain-containing protein n=1 Tax=Acanthamoeba castellanii (strain ATCC 30010 / Neff) TaxID=1257118 RepID=L8GYW8_ACACF|nr:uncharacterized protein ACA1_060380 [Acanthamoeba castellanii str. Neff]ELR17311.1 hypothetical protein ACA1_060380 [Acanthamoeba castellanii str. Neff]
MRRERSQSLNPSSLTGRGGTSAPVSEEGADPLKPVAPSSGAAAKNTLEDIVTNTFRTFAQVIIQARSQRLGGHDPAPSSSPHHRPDVYSPEASTWLNYYLDCLWAVDEDLAHFWRDWKRNERRSAIDLTLDIFAQLPSSDPPSRSRGTSQQPPPPQQHQQQLRRDLATSQPFLLERWVLSFNAKPNGEARHNTINVKKTAMVLRSVGSVVRALPAHKLVRLRRKQPTSFSIDYALYPSACASLISVEYATNLPSFKFQALKIEPFVISDYAPSPSEQSAARGEPSTVGAPGVSPTRRKEESATSSPRGATDISDRSARDRKSLERATSLPVFLPSSSPGMQPPITSLGGHATPPVMAPALPPAGRANLPSSASIPIRGAGASGQPRGGRGGGDDDHLDIGALAMLGTSTSPPKMMSPPVFSGGGLVSPSTSAGGGGGGGLSTRGTAAVGSAGKGNANFFNFSTPPFTRDFFLQQQQQQQHFPRSSPGFPFVEDSGSSPWEGAGSSASRSLETSGSYSESIFPTLLPPSSSAEDVGEIPGLLYTKLPASQPAFSVATQEIEVSSFLESCAHPPDLKMFSQSKNMAQGTEDLETLSRSLRRLSIDLGDARKRAPGNKQSSRETTEDDPLFFDM